MTKFIFITGGVISSVGKGILTSSIASLIESQGYKVTAMKIDPYINLDAGTMRPTEHGEVFVTDDGFETDQDLGNYERFTSMTLSRDNSLTTGQIYKKVIDDERAGKYKGKCVEVIPHIPLEVIRRIKLVAKRTNADFVFVEIGATAGEYQIFPFLDAVRRMKFKGDDVLCIHVGYLPIPQKVGEQKSKPLQRSIMDIQSCGVQPDFVIGRSELPIDKERKEKIALNCSIDFNKVISSHDTDFIYEVPLILRKQNLDRLILEHFKVKKAGNGKSREWENLIKKIKSSKKEVKIGIVGKYFDIGDFTLEDSYISVIEAIKHASWHLGLIPKTGWVDSKEFENSKEALEKLKNYHAIIVPGGFGEKGIEGKISAIKYCRENKIPYLGLCYGLQLAVIEFARNVCNIPDTHSTEVNRETENPVVDILPEQKRNLEDKNFGASMRLGAYEANLKKNTIVHSLYKKNLISERHRHRWEVNKVYEKVLERNGLIISGINPQQNLVEFIELPKEVHPFFVATQAHPEFKSRFLQPAPLFLGLIEATKRYKINYFQVVTKPKGL